MVSRKIQFLQTEADVFLSFCCVAIRCDSEIKLSSISVQLLLHMWIKTFLSPQF